MAELLFRDDPYLRVCGAEVVATEGGSFELDRTVFYAAGGGQPGDTGSVRLADESVLRVVDSRKLGDDRRVLHMLEPGGVAPPVGTRLEARIDWERRHRHMRMHTALHLLCAVVRAPVTGGRIADDKAHLDFDIEMDKLSKEDIESRLNELVVSGLDTRPMWITDAELDERPDLVKTMSVAPPRGTGGVRLIEIPGVDLQACGGTHVANTREIGALMVTRIRSEGRRNRRVTLGFAA